MSQAHNTRTEHHNQALGKQGEQLAARYLEETLGWRLLAQNWRHGTHGELDLVAHDGESIVAVEVKTRSGLGYGTPFEAITAHKAARLRRLLFSWVHAHHPGAAALRVDAIGVTLLPGDEPRVEHLRGIA